MKKNYVIGLMSGTSMDGINASLVNTDGKTLSRTGHQVISNYSEKTIKLLKKYVFDYDMLKKNISFYKKLSKYISYDNYLAVRKIVNLSGINPDLIGYHGQTVFHDSSKKISIQLGDGDLLAKLSQTKVISKFRQNDIKNGGEGAPISPIYHKLLMEKLNLTLPCCFLNIGGVSNISYWDGTQLLGFDLGPGNGIMDIFCQENLDISFDRDGIIASKGNPNYQIINEFLKLPYFKKPYPKSLDRLEFNFFVNKLQFSNNNSSDILATFLEFTVHSIIKGINLLPSQPKIIVVMGGGQHNKYLLRRIVDSFCFDIVRADEIGIPGDFIEAEMIAYIAARKVNNLPITFPYTTGVQIPCVGGEINLV